LLAECEIFLGESDAAKHGLRQLLDRQLNDDQRASAQIVRAHFLLKFGDARAAFKELVSLIRAEEIKPWIKARGRWIAANSLFRAGHYSWARHLYELSAAYYRLNSDRENLAQMLLNIGLVCKNQGDMRLGLVFLDESMKLLPASGFSRMRAIGILNRGVCLHRLGNLEKAREAFITARALAMESGNRLVGIAVSNNLAHLYRMQMKFDTAREFYTEALAAARAISDPRRECLSLEFLGETLLEEGKPAEAIVHLNEAFELAKKLASQGDLVMEILRRRGEARIALGQRSEGLQELHRAIGLCHSRGEQREMWLAKRSFALAMEFAQPSEFESEARDVLVNLQRLGDRFEYARSVCLFLETGRLDAHQTPWLQEAVATATHYFSSMGIRAWKERMQRLVGHSRYMRQPTPVADDPRQWSDIQTRSSVHAQALDLARTAARSKAPVLLLGETGCGKEVFSKLIHDRSARAGNSMVAINCGGLPENLVESELFGHARGAFTGADRDKTGLMELANGGTALLDEIGDLPAGVQVKLLRFLDSYEFRRIGETQMRKVDVRVLAATNRDLQQLVDQGKFRQDLFFRLNVFRIEIPPLRQRRDDILPLAERFLVEDSESTLPLTISEDLARWLVAYDWPGNVRELRNVCRYLSTRAWGKPEAGLGDLPPNYGGPTGPGSVLPTSTSFEREKWEFQRAQILRAMQESKGSIIDAASLLGMSRNQVSRKLREYGVTREAFRV
jgi:DNA-binding NtrC family response regulator